MVHVTADSCLGTAWEAACHAMDSLHRARLHITVLLACWSIYVAFQVQDSASPCPVPRRFLLYAFVSMQGSALTAFVICSRSYHPTGHHAARNTGLSLLSS